jgi:FtsZ-interacting cell division protein ZipA
MSKDTVKLFQRARAALQSERDSLSKALANAQATAADAEKRLAEIEAALGGAGTAPAKRRGRKPKKAAGKRRGRPAKKTAAKRGRPAKKKAAAKQKTVKKKAAKKAPRKAVKKAAKKAPKKAVKKAAKKAPKKAVKKAPKKAAKKAPAKKVKNKLSLKQVALAVTKGKALDAKQILEAAKKAGHKFSGKNPLNSLRVMLYTNKKAFKNDKGKFVAA